MFFLLYGMSFFMVMNFDDWFLVWVGMEINMISFLFLIYYNSSMINVESCVKYFFVQSVGSGIFMSLFYLNLDMFLFYGSILLSMKMGGGIFYFWFPLVCKGISWFSCFMLMSFQKIIPLILMNYFDSWMILWMMIISMMVGVIMSFNQINMKMLMAYSSIHQIGWLMMCVMVDSSLWFIYLIMYLMIIFPLFWMFSIYEVNNFLNMISIKMKLFIIFLMMNLGGIPPFLGFFLKWLGFYYMMSINISITILMVIMSGIMFYVYLRVSFNLMMGNLMIPVSILYNNSSFLMLGEMLMLLGLVMGNFMMILLMY